MKFIAHHSLAILAAILMLGGLFFWTLTGLLIYQAYKSGKPATFMISLTASTATPTSPPASPTYIAIPTVEGQTTATLDPQVTATIEPSATPEPTSFVNPTEQPTIAATAAPTVTAVPTALPTDAPTPGTQVPTEAPVAAAPVCPTLKNEVLLVEGSSTLPVASALALLYDGTYVGGGTVKPGGLFSIPLANAPRVAGDHTIDVVQRGTENHVHPVFVKRTTCTLAL